MLCVAVFCCWVPKLESARVHHSLRKIGVALVDNFIVYQLVCRPWNGGNIIAVN